MATNIRSVKGSSVNDSIPSDLCSIQYLKIEEVAQALVQSGLGTPMVKIDVQSAYRIISLLHHPTDTWVCIGRTSYLLMQLSHLDYDWPQ